LFTYITQCPVVGSQNKNNNKSKSGGKDPKKISTDCANETGAKETGCLDLMVGRRFDRGMTRLETTPPVAPP